MKQKCSFLLKSGIALILSFLMLFGSMTTSLAAVVDNADTGADVDLAETGSFPSAGSVVYLEDINGWSNAYLYMENSSGTALTSAWPGTQMTYLGLTNNSHGIFAATVPSGTPSKIIFNNGSSGNANQTADLSPSWFSNNCFSVNVINNNNWGSNNIPADWSLSITKPTLSLSNVTVTAGSSTTSTVSVTNSVSVGKYSWSSSNTSKATVSGTTATATINGVAAGTSTLTAKAWADKPYSDWSDWQTTDATYTFLGGTATSTITVNAAATPSIDTFTIDSGSSATLNIGETATLVSTTSNTSNSVTYSTTSDAISISGTTVTALKPVSSATITATLTDGGTYNKTVTVTVRTPQINLSYSPSSIAATGSSTATPTATVNSSYANSGSTLSNLSYSITSGSSYGSINSSTGVVTSTTTAGTVTAQVTGTVSYNGVSYTGAVGSANITVTSLATVYFNYNGAGENDNPTMTYDATASATKGAIVYKLDLNWKGNSTYYIKVYDGSDRYTTGSNITDNYPLSGSGYSLTTSGSNWVVLKTNTSISSSSTAKYTFYYDYTNKKLYVEYPHVVSFNANGHGTAPSSQVVTYGGTATTPTAPTATGYTFGGWYKEAECTNAWDFSNDTVTEDTTLYAKWTTNSHTVTYPTPSNYTLGGSMPTSAAYGETVSFTVTPSSGYRIKSVKYTPSGGSATDCTAGSNNAYSFTMPDADVTVSVEAVQTYTVTVSAGTGGSVAASSLTVDSGTATTLPAATPDYGYKFVNWTTTGGTLGSATSDSAATITTTSAVTVTANFEKDDGMNLYIAGRFRVQTGDDTDEWTNSFDSGDWSNTGDDNIKFVWDSTEEKYKVETHASLANLTSQISGSDPYFFVYDTTASKGWHPTSNTDLTTSKKSANLTSNDNSHNVKFAASTAVDKPVVIWFDATTQTLTYTVPTFYDVTVTTPITGGMVSAVPARAAAGTTITLTNNPNEGYRFGSYSVYKTGDSSTTVTVTNGTFTMPAYDVTVNATFTPIVPVITYAAYKTDDGSTLTTGGGTITAKEIKYTAGTEGTGTATYLYLWWSGSDNPEQHSNKANAVLATDGSYYASFQPTGNFYFNITDSSSSATSGTQKITSGTTADVDSNVFAGWTTVGNWGTWYIGKGYLNSGDTVYIKYDPSNNIVYFRNSAFTYTIEYTGGDGGTDPTETEIKTLASGDTITYNHRVYFTATAATDYAFEGWYSNAACTTLLSTDKTYKTTNLTDDYTIYAKFKKLSFITLYNSYMKNTSGEWQFVASPPRRVEIYADSSATTPSRTYVYDTGGGDQRGEEYVLYDGGTYYEGNKLVVYPGEKVKLIFSTLASSDAIKGVFFNNDRRYTTESETDNLYYLREYKEGGWGSGTTEDPYVGGLTGEGESVPDDDWEYTFLSGTTIYADSGYYTDEATTISAQQSNYAANKTGGAVDQSAHTIEWIAEGSYLNIDIQLDYKYQVHINGDDWSGLSIENMNDEGYYYHGENFTKTVDSTTKQFKISIDQPTDGSGTYSWDSTSATLSLNSNPSTPEPPSGVTVTAKKSDGTNASSASEISYFLVEGEMPNSALYITLPLTKKYNMKLANIVVTDTIGSKTMLTEGAATTDVIGSITAVPSLNGTAGSDISTDDTTYYTYHGHNNETTVSAYDNNSSGNNVQIRGGLNKIGSDVTAGSTVTYTFTFENGNDANYSFVGWYEGSLSGSLFTVDYSKKLSGKTSFTYTPKKDTVVIAVGTRDMYLGGNFTSDGAYTSTSANQTWSSGRILMNYDPTYVNPSNSSQKGRYYYTFDTVTANTEYKFRVYDTVSGSDFTNLTVWNSHIDNISGYKNDNVDIADYRSKYDSGQAIGWTTHAGFMFTNATGKSFSEIKVNGTDMSDKSISQNHATNGYGNPVTVYFYAYDSGVSVNSTYQWSKAYVSAGVGIDVLSVSNGTTTYNTPSVSVADTTVAGGTVDGTTSTVAYGQEAIYECTVKEKDGQIQVTANPNDVNLCVQAFLIYNIDTKTSEAITVTSSGGAVTQNITIPQNSKLYIVPIYKFTDAYIASAGLETHTVYVRAEDIDKDDWGGLVSMYSWGTDEGYDSGGWPGQLMIPSDDGNSFYAPLTFKTNGLAGVTFNNYTKVWGGAFVNFLGLYQSRGVSDTVYSSYTNTSTHYINQAYDYREPISIIENINDGGIYDSEDMDLTFALKQGNKNGTNFGSGTYSASYDWEYLTDRSGKKRVDLNGNALSTSATATYYVVCSYTRDYVSGGSKSYDFKDGSRDGTSAHNCYSIEWTVYDQEHTKIGSEKLSAAYTDVYKSEMLTYVAKMLDSYGYPVSGKAVQIAYEDPGVALLNEDGNATEAKRFSGQWYADGVNSLIEGNVRVGIYSDGAWLPSDSNAPGYGTATVSVTSGMSWNIPNAATGEAFVQEDGCSGNSLVKVTKTHATNGGISFTVNTTDNFLGWYRDDGEGGFEPVGSNYKNQTITPSFNSDITYYAFYSASASYRVKYTGRDGSIKYFTAKGTDLTSAELADSNQYLNDSERASDISTKLAKSSDINVFNKSYSITFSSPTKTAYTLTYDAVQNDSTYTLTVYSYNSSGTLTQSGTVTGAYNTEVDLTDSEIGGAGVSLITNKPTTDNKYFVGWKRYVPGTGVTGEIISTRANFGYALSEDLTIAPVFSNTKPSTDGTWSAYVDKNVITQELTNATTGIIYNDNIVSFKYSADTATQVNRETNECGIVILAQTGGVTSAQSSSFTSLADNKMATYLNALKTNNKTSAKMSSSTYGEAYAFYIPAESLSRLNRVDIYQVLDYTKFNGGNYKVAAYYTNSGGTYTMSNVISDTYTPHSYSRATGTRTPAAD